MSLLGAVVVTGASGGLGFQLVSDLLALGLRNVVCQYRSTPRGLPELLKSRGLAPDDHLFQADLVHEAEVARLQARAKERYGRGRIFTRPALWRIQELLARPTIVRRRPPSRN